MSSTNAPPLTPDKRYIVVRGRLWRSLNPNLSEMKRQRLVADLMDARRAVAAARRVHDHVAETQAHEAVDREKQALGERGPVWWDGGAPDYNRHLVNNSPYAEWYAALDSD